MLRLVRWWVVLLGGIFLGAGRFLHGQVAVAFFMREAAQDTFFLWRWVGQITFIFQDETTKAALWMNEIPEEVIRESSRAAWFLVVAGGAMALLGPWLLQYQHGKARK